MSEAIETSHIPESVKARGQAADDLIKGLGPNTPEGGSDDPENPDVDPNQDPEPEPEPAPEPEPKGGTDKDNDPNSDTWQSRYNILKGKYDAEVPRLHQDKRELQQQMQKLQTQVHDLQQKVEEGGSQGEPPGTQGKLNPEDFAAYGEEFSQLVQQFNSVMDENAQLKRRLDEADQTIGSVKEHQAQSAEERFWAELNDSVPKWNQINQDPGFLEWLKGVEPFSGKDRNTSLQEAHSALDASRVTAIFERFIEDTEAGSQYRESKEPPPAEKEKGKPKRPSNVQPEKARGEGPAPVEGKRTWTSEDIKKFYNDVRRGAFEGREEERKRIENDLFQAQREGRVSV